MEQLIIFLVIGAASLLSGYFQNKKKREAEAREMEREAALPARPESRTAPTSPAEPPPTWPTTGTDWREELRRLLQGQLPEVKESPPKLPPVLPRLPEKATQVPLPIKEIPQKIGKKLSQRVLVKPRPMKTAKTYERASRLREQIQERWKFLNPSGKSHQDSVIIAPTRPPESTGAAVAKRWTRNRANLREAFIASLIFAPPVGLSPSKENGAPDE